MISEPFSGAWQRNVVEDDQSTLLKFSPVYACVSGIATDVAKMRLRLMRKTDDGIWEESTEQSPFAAVLRRPNAYQNRIKFIEQWMTSKLLDGNTYILKERDGRGVVRRLHVLHPMHVKVLVAEDGSVFYELNRDLLAEVKADVVTVPASEIIHDMMLALWHPLVGVSPLYACAIAATMGNQILSDSTNFFGNRSVPSGILSGPDILTDDQAKELRQRWEDNYGGNNAGKVAVLGKNLKFEALRMQADHAQLAEQLGFTVEDVARSFHYPIHKLGGKAPEYAGSVDAANLGYYTDCLQQHIENIELSVDEGLSLPPELKTEFDLNALFRMDQKAIYETNEIGTRSGVLAPNEGRKKLNLRPKPGGNTPYLQEQNYSLEALSKRDALDNPFGAKNPPSSPDAVSDPEISDKEAEDIASSETEREWRAVS